MEKLEDAAIQAKLEAYPDWSLSGGSLQRTFVFDDFLGSMAFVNRVAALAEALQHHPDIMIRFSKVTLTLSTHDVGGISERDFAFASQVGAVAEG